MAAGGTTVALTIVSSFGTACLLLLLGHWLRVQLRVLRSLYLPASLVGGLLGLLLRSLLSLHTTTGNFVEQELLAGWDELPNFLISVVFACLFLGERIPPVREVWQTSGPQLMYGQIVAWGQYALPILLTAVVLKPVFGVNDMIAATVPLGFEGGHGTAAGVKSTFEELGYSVGANLTLFAATIGLLSGVLFGTVLINWALKAGHVQSFEEIGDPLFTGVYAEGERPSAGLQTTSVDSIDSSAFHLCIVGAALAFGYALKRVLLVAEENSDWLTEYKFFSAFPLFPFCMFGGILIQLGIDKWAKPSPVDRATCERISGIALEFTIVTAIVTMEFSEVAGSLVPFFILVVLVFIWHLFCFLFLARRLLPNFWVERSIAELGQSMGVTATGLLLLRMVDPQNETPALVAFSYKQLLHEPIVGGGLWTASCLPFIASAGIWPATGLTFAALVFWFAMYFAYFRPMYRTLKYRPLEGEGEGEGGAGEAEDTPLIIKRHDVSSL